MAPGLAIAYNSPLVQTEVRDQAAYKDPSSTPENHPELASLT